MSTTSKVSSGPEERARQGCIDVIVGAGVLADLTGSADELLLLDGSVGHEKGETKLFTGIIKLSRMFRSSGGLSICIKIIIVVLEKYSKINLYYNYGDNNCKYPCINRLATLRFKWCDPDSRPFLS